MAGELRRFAHVDATSRHDGQLVCVPRAYRVLTGAHPPSSCTRECAQPRVCAWGRSRSTALGLVRLASAVMDQPDLIREAREAVLRAIIKSAPTVGNSPAGIRDLAEAYALLERDLVPHAGVVRHRP